jgi:glutaredoxin 3
MKKVSIYSTATCTYCKHAKELFKEKGIAYEEFDVGTDAAKRKEMVDLTGQLGVPVIRIDDNVMVGFDQEAVLKALDLA